MLEHDLLAFSGRFHHRQTHLERRHAPAAIVPQWFSKNYRIVQLLQFRSTLGHAHRSPGQHIDLFFARIAVNVDAIARLAHVGTIQAGDRHAHIFRCPRFGLVAPKDDALLVATNPQRLFFSRLGAGALT